MKPMWAKIALTLAVCVMVFGVQARFSQSAHADGSCGPGLNYQQYQSLGCTYNTVQPYTVAADGYVYINVYIDSSIPPNVRSDAQTAMTAWSNAIHVRFTQVSSAPSSNSNGLTMTSAPSDPWGGSCNLTWGNGWNGGSSNYHTLSLNSNIFTHCYGWSGLIAHEMGHDMGLAHNSYNNGYELMLGGAPIKVSTPQTADIAVWNSIYLQTQGCASYAADPECDNQDYVQQSCNDYPQETASNAYASVTLHYSTNCQSNWSSAKILGGGYVIKQEQIQRSGTFAPGQAGSLAYSDYPGTSTWYTNMIWAPNNSARSCVWYGPANTNNTYGPVCTAWH